MAKANRTGVPITIYVPQGMREALRRLCGRTERSLNTEVLRAVRAHLQVEGESYEEEPEPQRRKAKARGNK